MKGTGNIGDKVKLVKEEWDLWSIAEGLEWVDETRLLLGKAR